MQFGSIALYYNIDKGFIIGSDTTIKHSIIQAIVPPVSLIKAGTSYTELGNAILGGLEKSRKALSVEGSEIKNFKFWQITGIKGFAAFSRKFQCVEICETENCIKLLKLIQDADGGYSYPADMPFIEISLDTTAKKLGSLVMDIMSKESDEQREKFLTFNTVFDNVVKYIRPFDDLINIGDGHTDVYQIYTYVGDDRNYIAFLIDNGYIDYTENAIRKRWRQMYGELETFEYKKVDRESLKIQIYGKSKTTTIVSHLYQDGEGMMEVLSELNSSTLSEKEQKRIKEEFEKIISSVLIEKA